MSQLNNWNPLHNDEEDVLRHPANRSTSSPYSPWNLRNGGGSNNNLLWSWKQRKYSFVKLWILALILLITLLWIAVIYLLLVPGNNSNKFEWWVGENENGKNTSSPFVNNRPIIGVLAQEYQFYQHHDFHGILPTDRKEDNETSYIAASYVKFIEGAGAQVVPILINGNETYLKFMFERINGLLFPGGAVPLDDGSKYGQSGRILYNLALEANKNGDYFPVWGTCLGFEFMMFAAADYREVRTDCASWNVKNRLKFTESAASSRLYGNADRDIIKALGTQEVTVNFHKFCVTPENFTKFGIDKTYRVLSVNFDPVANLTYVSSAESKQYPFYAVQFHPEKNIYEWTSKETIPHTPEAVKSAQYFANFFVAEARNNSHKFDTEAQERQHVIYNYEPAYSGNAGSTFEQLYFFQM